MKRIIISLLIISQSLYTNFFSINNGEDLNKALTENKNIIVYVYDKKDKITEENHKNLQEVITQYDEFRDNVSAASIDINNKNIEEALKNLNIDKSGFFFFTDNKKIKSQKEATNVIPQEILFEYIKNAFNIMIDIENKTTKTEYTYNETNIKNITNITNEEYIEYSHRPIDYYWPYYAYGAPFWNPFFYYGYGLYGFGLSGWGIGAFGWPGYGGYGVYSMSTIRSGGHHHDGLESRSTRGTISGARRGSGRGSGRASTNSRSGRRGSGSGSKVRSSTNAKKNKSSAIRRSSGGPKRSSTSGIRRSSGSFRSGGARGGRGGGGRGRR